MTLEGTPDIVSPSGVAGLDFLDEADTANRYARELRRRGVKAIVVLLHEGGTQTAPFGINDCNGISGPIVDIVGRTTAGRRPVRDRPHPPALQLRDRRAAR